MTTTTTSPLTHRADDAPPAPPPHARAAARSRELVDLMVRRPDLAGVYSPADVAAESVSWSA